MNTNVSDILNAIAEAKLATERVPELEAKVRELQDALERKTQSADRLVDDLSKSTESNAELRGTIRSLEVERDDYGFRLIEAEDKLKKVAAVFGTVAAEVKSAEVEVAKSASPLSDSPSVGEISSIQEVGNTSVHATCQGDAGDWPKPKPYDGRTHWQKPDSMSWGEWHDGGGATPYWYTDSYFDRQVH